MNPAPKFQQWALSAALMINGTSLFGQSLGPRDVDALPATAPTAVLSYGTNALQFGQLRIPAGKGSFPVAIVIHGGCWTKGFATLTNTAAIASELSKKGIATWNIEYRQVGDEGGGWPGTFLDWGAAADYVRVLAKTYPLNLTQVIVLGHSAGAHAALWVAARPRLPSDSVIRGADPISVEAAVAIDGWGDLPGSIDVAARVCGRHVVEGLIGGTPEEFPERYAQGSPQALLPLGVRQFLITATALPLADAEAYQRIAREYGEEVEILTPPNARHFEVIAPGWTPYRAVEELILERAISPDPRSPVILTAGPSFGIRTNGFSFVTSSSTNATTVVEASTNLSPAFWFPVSTNTPAGGTAVFSDPQWKEYLQRFFRVRLP